MMLSLPPRIRSALLGEIMKLFLVYPSKRCVALYASKNSFLALNGAKLTLFAFLVVKDAGVLVPSPSKLSIFNSFLLSDYGFRLLSLYDGYDPCGLIPRSVASIFSISFRTLPSFSFLSTFLTTGVSFSLSSKVILSMF